MEAYENRIINGLLKAEAIDDPERAVDLLARDFEIIADPARATEDDLWPAIWALAAVLERQFSGHIVITAGLERPLRQPASLGPRCHFEPRQCSDNATRIYLGCQPTKPDLALWGDTRKATIRYGSLIDSAERASPLGCFALAGYLGFASLALAARLPGYREEFATTQIELPFQDLILPKLPEEGLEFVGLGHLGQAYLALFFFLALGTWPPPQVQLLDKDFFETANWSTQILIETEKSWKGEAKAEYLRERVRSWGWRADSDRTEITWGWHRSETHSKFAVLGLDKFDVRRMAINGGYTWVFDAGVGDSFLRPRISWHSIPADNALAKRLFPETEATVVTLPLPTTPFIDRLRDTPGGCGLLTYQGTTASAPSLGLVASAFLWSELLCFLSGNQQQIQGSATIWSPLLPFLRTELLHRTDEPCKASLNC